jgi:ADP-ribose pyrophosphatase
MSRATIIGSRTAYKGRIFDVVVERVRLPDRETESEVEVVKHAGSVVLAAMPTADSVLLVRQYRHPAADFLWELPAGSIDPGEDAVTAARRECHEELGVIADTVERLGEQYPLPGYCTELMTFFRLTSLRAPTEHELAEQDEDEDIEAQAFTLAQVRQMVMNGEIRDVKTAAALVLLGR